MGKFKTSFRCFDNTLIVKDERGWGYMYNPTGIPTSFTSMWLHIDLYDADGNILNTIQQNVTSYYGTPPNQPQTIFIPITQTGVYFIETKLMINNVAENAKSTTYYICRAMDCLAKKIEDMECGCKGNNKKEYIDELIKLWILQFNNECIEKEKAIETIKKIEEICQ